MAKFRVSQNVTYTSDTRGVRELGQSRFVGAAALEAARAVQSWAQADDPDGGYSADRTTVRAGRSNESRAGAVVREVERGEGHFRRTLVRAAQEARSRGTGL